MDKGLSPDMMPRGMCWKCATKYNYRDYTHRDDEKVTCKVCGSSREYYVRYNKQGEPVPYHSCGYEWNPDKPVFNFEDNPYKCHHYCEACGLDISKGDTTKPGQISIKDLSEGAK